MCEMTSKDNVKSIPVILTGDVLTYYANLICKCPDFDEVMTILRNWNNIDDRKARILSKWPSMALLYEMTDDTSESKVTVSRKFEAKLKSFHSQLDGTYLIDQFLRNGLHTEVNIPQIQPSLPELLPRSIQQSVNRIANRYRYNRQI